MPTATPTATKPPAPQIEFFRADPSSIVAGACATLEWGVVTNAYQAVIDHGIGGVGTPGDTTVCPIETTLYVLTATGPGGTTTASTTITVSTPQPDLRVESIVFDPSPAVQGQATGVRITIRNVGTGAAGGFNWEWLAGSEARFDGRVAGLNAGDSTVATASWTPVSVVASLSTVARVDIGNEVTENDESNNALTVNIQVVAPSLGDLVLQEFFLSTDNEIVIRLSNPGGGITAPTFGYQVYQDGALVHSGSDTTPVMGSRATWTGYTLTGEYTIRIVIDPDNLIAESNEGNNELTLDCNTASHSCSPP
jgi:subtilase family serine protease